MEIVSPGARRLGFLRASRDERHLTSVQTETFMRGFRLFNRARAPSLPQPGVQQHTFVGRHFQCSHPKTYPASDRRADAANCCTFGPSMNKVTTTTFAGILLFQRQQWLGHSESPRACGFFMTTVAALGEMRKQTEMLVKFRSL